MAKRAKTPKSKATSSKKKIAKLSDFCKKCPALRLLELMVRDHDLFAALGPARKLLDEKLGKDPRLPEPKGHEKHPGLRKFCLVVLQGWQPLQMEPCWFEDTGDLRWHNRVGGYAPKADGDVVRDTMWLKGWNEVPGDPGEEDDDDKQDD